MERLSQKKGKHVNKIDTFFVEHIHNLGNMLVEINNIIFYCEVIGCNKIILKNHDLSRQWLLKKPVYIKKLNITIMTGPDVNCDDDNIYCVIEQIWDPYYPKIVWPELRIQYLRDEFFRNLPKVKTNSKDLYIHIRGGDVFQKHYFYSYAQPPLCFYEKIINNNKFKNIYILAMDRKNVVLDALINKYNFIIYENHEFDYDFSLLVHAYNFVTSVSSFATSAIKFNNNLRN